MSARDIQLLSFLIPATITSSASHLTRGRYKLCTQRWEHTCHHLHYGCNRRCAKGSVLNRSISLRREILSQPMTGTHEVKLRLEQNLGG